MRAARRIAIGQRKYSVGLQRHLNLIKPLDHLANPVLPDSLKAGHFGEESAIVQIKKISQYMELVPFLLRGQLGARDEFNSRSRAGAVGPLAALDRVMIRQREAGQAKAFPVTDQLLGRVSPVGEKSMQVKVGKHCGLFHDSRWTEQLPLHFVQ